MVILGIDPSLTGTGCIKLSKGKIIVRQLIRTKPVAKNTIKELSRLQAIRDLIDLKDVKYAALEGLAMSTRNSTALTQLSGLNYMIREYLHTNGIEFIVVPPTQLKKFVSGKGNCKKDLMLLETYKRYGESFEDDNLCDAFCLAKIAEAYFLGAKTNKIQADALESLKSQNYG